MRSMKGEYFEQDVDQLVRGMLEDGCDDIAVEDALDYVSGHMNIKGRESEARRIIERRLG